MLRITTTHRDQATRTSKLEGKLLDRLFNSIAQKLTDTLELLGFASFALGKFHVVSADTRSSSPQAHPLTA